MLPDFPSSKRELADVIDDFVRARVDHHLGALSEVRQETIPEGANTRIERPDGSTEDSPFTEVAAKFELKTEEIGRISFGALLQRLDDMALDIAGQIGRDMYSRISASIERVGNARDAGGKRLTAQTILEGYETVQIDFDERGQPILPQLHIHPSLSDAVRLAATQLETDPELRREFRSLIADKKEAWRDREAGRKLVG